VPSNRVRRQGGFGLVEVLVASALMAVALVVLLGSVSSLLLGSRVAERRTVEQRLARTQIEELMAQDPLVCPPPTTQAVDRVTYTIETICAQSIGYVELTVTVRDPSGGILSLSNDRVGS
jgi:prepilin-type N-terminal cleavage/methylation domain-containing protein